MYFSKSTGGFYERAIHGDTIPADAVEITREAHAALLEGQSAGKVISADIGGMPVLADPPKATAESVWTAIKAQRDRIKAGGVRLVVDGVDRWFHSDDTSRIQHLGLKDAARDLLGAGGVMADRIQIDGADVLWKTMDGTFAHITAQLAFDIVDAAKVLDKQVFTAAETHKALMEASPDPSAYDYSTDWPKIYGED